MTVRHNHSFEEPATGTIPVAPSSLADDGLPVKARGGDAPPVQVQVPDARSADLITPAQVTPETFSQSVAWKRQLLRLQRSRRRPSLLPLKDVLRVAASGIGRGLETKGRTRGEWDISGTCSAPRPVELNGAARELQRGRYVRTPGSAPYNLLLWTRCRKCPECLGRRRNLWAARARDEVMFAERTWFATFTFSPAWHYQLENRASARLHVGGTDLRRLPANEAFAEIMKEYSAEVTKWLKRVRKNTGARLRYILVAERHKSGRPHFHALIHENIGSSPIRHSDLTSAWNLGFTKFKLVSRDVKACWYVAKYLAKDATTRVRASLSYGSLENARRNSSSQSIAPTTWPPARETPPPTLSFNEKMEQTNQTKDEENETHNNIQQDSFQRPQTIPRTYPPGSPAAYSSFSRAGASTEASTKARSEAFAAAQALASTFAKSWRSTKSSSGWTFTEVAPLTRMD